MTDTRTTEKQMHSQTRSLHGNNSCDLEREDIDAVATLPVDAANGLAHDDSARTPSESQREWRDFTPLAPALSQNPIIRWPSVQATTLAPFHAATNVNANLLGWVR